MTSSSLYSRWALAAIFVIETGLIAGYGGVYTPVWGLAVIASLTVWLVLLITIVLHQAWPEWDPLFWPTLAFGALVAAQWCFHYSVYSADTLTGLAQLSGLGAIFYLAIHSFRDAEQVRNFGLWAWIMSGVLGAEALVQAFTAKGFIYWIHDAHYATPMGPFVYHNHFAGCAEMLLPLSYVYAFRKKSSEGLLLTWLRRGIFPILLLASIVVSASRGGVAIAGLEILVMAGWLRLRGRVRLQPIWIAVLLLAVAVGAVGWGPLARRLGKLGQHDASVRERWLVSQTCLNIFADHQWIGTGFATFPSVYPKYESFDNGKLFLQAHDEYAQTLSETGVLGILCVGSFILLLIMGARPLGIATTGFEGRVRRAAFLGASALLVHSAFDFQFHAPANAALFFILVAAARSPKPVGSEQKHAMRARKTGHQTVGLASHDA